MPLLNEGLNVESIEGPLVLPALTKHQYELMKKWSVGLFKADWTGSEPIPLRFDEIPAPERPAALDRAALEACVGYPFFPGIETGYVIASPDTYRGPFRISTSKMPGDLTAEMAVPWQADFLACADQYWPGQRPVTIHRDGALQDWAPKEWIIDPEVDPKTPGYIEMVQNWSRLGFVVQRGEEFVERERNLPFVGV